MKNKRNRSGNVWKIVTFLFGIPIILMAVFLPVVNDTIGEKTAFFCWKNLETINSADNRSLIQKVKIQENTDSIQNTSVNYRYNEKFSETLSEYAQFENLYCAECSTAIPGLENTVFSDSASQQMVPQGICIAGDYMLISAYDKKKEEKSVIYILSNTEPENRELLATLVLPEKTHAGGITFDGERVWIAGSDTETIRAISGERIREAAESGQESIFLKAYDLTLDCGVTASFLGYQDGRLWVGTFHSFFTKQGMLSVFRLDEENGEMCLKQQFRMDIPNHAQGISFVRQDARDFVVLSVSQGRFRDSALYVYEESISDSRVILTGKWKFTLPPMAEELVSDGVYTYCLFESAATCYSDAAGLSCPWIVDRVCALDNERLAGGG